MASMIQQLAVAHLSLFTSIANDAVSAERHWDNGPDRIDATSSQTNTVRDQSLADDRRHIGHGRR